MNRRFKEALYLSIVSLSIFALSACGLLGLQQEVVPAALCIEVKDPVFRRITEVTDTFQISACGNFHPGTTILKGLPVNVPNDTSFQLELTLPVKDPSKIETAAAVGSIVMNKQISIAGAPLPQKIVLEDGKASGRIDLIRLLGVYIYNSLQNQSVPTSGGGEMKKLIDSLTVSHANINFRKNASFDLGHLHVNAAPNSKIEFNDVIIDNNADYHGLMALDLKFDKGCKYDGKKIDMYFNAGQAKLALEASRKSDILALKLGSQQKPIALNDATYKFGKDEKDTVCGNATLRCREFTWEKRDLANDWVAHFLSDMQLQNARLAIHNSKIDLTASFSQPVNSVLTMDLTPKDREYKWNTDKAYMADTLTLTLNRPTSSVDIRALNANMGPFALDKRGDLGFNLDDGIASLKDIIWTTDKRTVSLICSKDSTVKITDRKDFNLARQSDGLHYDLPLTVQIGSAELTGTKFKTRLTSLNGKVDVKVEDEMVIDGDVDFNMESHKFLGDQPLSVKVHGIKMSGAKGHSDVRFKECCLTIPQKTLDTVLTREIPKEKTYDIDKVVLKGQKWRYRDAVIDQLTVRNLSLGDISCDGSNCETFKPQADLELAGTIEKSGILSVFKKSDKWVTKPWTASGTVYGTGTVNYQFIPNDSLAHSAIKYDVALTLPPPEDVEIDWSQVGDGLLAKAEHAVLVGIVKKMKPKTLNYNGTFKMFPKHNEKFSSWELSDVKTAGSGDKLQLKFQARMAI